MCIRFEAPPAITPRPIQEEADWDSTYLLCKYGKEQSPVDIQPSSAVVDDSAPPILWQPSQARTTPATPHASTTPRT